MECAKVKGFLSEYIDGVLDAQVKKLVEEHLSACKSCSEELASLKACIKELGALKGVEAPGDFLKKVHERIERRAGFGRIIRALFIPVRIKVPLEIAAAAAMVILTINLIQSERKTAYMPAKAKVEEMAKIAIEGPVGAELEREVAEQPVPPMALAPQPPPAEEKPIELALLIKQPVLAAGYEVGTDMNAMPESRMIMSMKSTAPSETEKGSGIAMRQSLLMPKEEKEKDEIESKIDAQVPSKKEESLKDVNKKVVASPYLTEAISKVKNLIELVDGKVTSVEETPLQYITAEIPAKNYSLFVEKLSSLGELQKPLPSVTGKDEELVQLRINFMPYK